jgi:hypothetical protein
MGRITIGTVAVAVVALAIGCSGQPGVAEAPVEDATVASDGSWVRVVPDAMSETQQQLRQRGTEAVQTMASRLMGELHGALDERGPDGAIEVCSMRAPEIAANVSNEYGLLIGRTSFRLRNPSNIPPEWAEKLVSQRVEDPVWLAGPGGEMAGMLPIRLKPECGMCHGPEEQIAGEVRAALAEMYPQDVATGFTEGDLRGWFWVEVPPAT